MKVLLITVRSDFGGGPRHVHQLVENLPDDVELYMAYPEQGDPYADMWKENPRIKGTWFIPYRSFSLDALFQLKSFVEKNRIDVIHSHGNGAGLYSRLLKLLGCKAKIVHTFHGITNNYSSVLKKISNQIVGFLLRPLTDRFILVGKGELELGVGMHVLNRKRSVVIYNGIETPEERTIRDDKIINIITLSRFDYQKNMDMAYEIAYRLKDNKNIRFTWVGDGDDMARLKSKAEAECVNITFTGFSKEPMKHLADADIYLSTSRFEGLPYALVEAASMSLPIVATNVVGNNECVKDGVSGFLFKTVDEAVVKINAMAQDHDMLVSMSRNSRDLFLEQFTITSMLEKICGLYEYVLNSNKK